MRKYIGVDAHCKYCDIAVVDEEGTLIAHRSVQTGAKNLVEAVMKIKGERHVIIEDSTLAGWLKRTLSPYCDRVEVVDPKRNALIASSEQKSDKSDAERLAMLYRGGYTHPVHHTDDMRQLELKETVLHYHDCVEQVIRFKNKLKALYRKHGIFCLPEKIYHHADGLSYIKQLPFPSSRHRARSLLTLITATEKTKLRAHKKIKKLRDRLPIIEMFEEIPGVGLIVAATVVAIVETPHRFPTIKHLCNYASLAVATPTSGGKIYRRYASKQGNRLLKKVLMQAAHNAAEGSRFGRQYMSLARRRDSSIAHRSVARSILSTMYAMWRTGECYRA